MTSVSTLPSPELLSAMNPATRTNSTNSTQAAQDRFMTLLVTQMKNQDPLNPLDNAQVTSQLAQLSTVTGIDKLNNTIEAMQKSAQASQSLQAASLIGRGVLVPGSAVHLVEGQSLFGVELAEPVDTLTAVISDAAGNPVRTLNLGPQSAGAAPLGWDGLAASGAAVPDGVYQVQFAAQRGGQPVAVSALRFAEVMSVSTGSQGLQLNLSGSQARAVLADVRQIL